MLEMIRRSAESWGVKILFGLIIIVFAFWGVGSMTGNKAAVIAYVDDEPIMEKDFMMAFERYIHNVRMSRPDLTWEQINQMGLKKQFLTQMIESMLLEKEAAKLNVIPSQYEIINEIKKLPAFQGADGKFDKTLYQRILSSQQISAGAFENDVRNSLMRQKMKEYVTLPAFVSEPEAKDLYEFVNEERKIDYIVVEAGNFTKSVSVTPAEIDAYYKENKEEFKIDPQVKIAYMLFAPETLADKTTVTDADIESYYKRKLKTDYTRQKEVKARHILIRVDKDAPEDKVAAAKTKIDEVAAKLKDGGNFAELAKEYSEGPTGPNGGDLGWVKIGTMVKPFETALFALKKGDISEPVRTQFGWHLILAEDRKEPGVIPLEQVRDEVRQKAAEENAADILHDNVDQALERIVTGSTLDTIAKDMNIPMKNSEFFAQKQAAGILGLTPEASETLFGMEVGDVTDDPLQVKDGYVLAKVLETKPADYVPLDKVRDQIEGKLRNQKSMESAKKAAEDLLAELEKGETPEGYSVRTSTKFNRQGLIQELGYHPELAQAAYDTSKGSWLKRPYTIGSGYALVKVSDVIAPPSKEWEAGKKDFIAIIEDNKRDQLFEAYIKSLYKSSNVTFEDLRSVE